MRSQVFELEIPTAAAPSTGTALATRDLASKWAQLSGAFTVGALTLQGSIDGASFFDLSSGSKSAKGLFEVVEHVAFMRVSKTTDFDAAVALHLIGADRVEG